MIQRIHIKNYKIFKDLNLEFNEGMNLIVGDNESGKSTMLEAISLVLNGRSNGRWIYDELNPYWFNTESVNEFFDSIKRGEKAMPPSILIEVYFRKEDQPQILRGKNNSSNQDCPGLALSIEPDTEYKSEFDMYLSKEHPPVIPSEYYKVVWKGFDGEPLFKKLNTIKTSIIDGRTINTRKGIDAQTQQMLSDYIDKKDKANLSVSLRLSKNALTESILKEINNQIKDTEIFKKHNWGLSLDQASSSDWEATIIPHISAVPFSMSGQGRQVVMKIALAMGSVLEDVNFVLIEEPENHLSHTTLTGVIGYIDDLSKGRQVFIATHSSYVLNRLGLDRLILLNKGLKAKFDDLSEDTIAYFRKQSGYDTLRLVLAKKLVIVEGPSDEMLFNRCYYDKFKRYPVDDEIDVITQGTRNKRGLELCHILDRNVAVLRDADKKTPQYWREQASDYLVEDKREMFVGMPENGKTLEPQVIHANIDNLQGLKEVVKLPQGEELLEYMDSNKTEVAWLIASSDKTINYPDYFKTAIDFVVRV